MKTMWVALIVLVFLLSLLLGSWASQTYPISIESVPTPEPASETRSCTVMAFSGWDSFGQAGAWLRGYPSLTPTITWSEPYVLVTYCDK